MKESRYQVLTQKILRETQSTIQITRMTQEMDGSSSHFTNKELIEQIGIHGIQVVKRVTDAVLRDYNVLDNEPTSNFYKNSKAQAQSILKPIEDLTSKSP
mmetsp:Transcript_28207/g.34936  ORF Transcript_28207/g.34936 Transcript_28207/m.34936 type:complete len:100 (+) Transcript_28207:752-1051(+)